MIDLAGFILGILSLIVLAPVHRWLERLVQSLEESRQATAEVLAALNSVNEWVAKYPHVSFKHSAYARMLLARLYQAEKRRSSFSRSKRMNPKILELIFDHLETDPDDDPPTNIASPLMGSLLFILAVWDDVGTFIYWNRFLSCS